MQTNKIIEKCKKDPVFFFKTILGKSYSLTEYQERILRSINNKLKHGTKPLIVSTFTQHSKIGYGNKNTQRNSSSVPVQDKTE